MATIIRRTNSDLWPVTVEEAKKHLYAEGEDESRDLKIRNALRAAHDYVGLQTSRLLSRDVYSLAFDEWPCSRVLDIPAAPFVSVDSLSYVDEDGDTQTVAESNFSVNLTNESASLLFASEFNQPAISSAVQYPITVLFLAGYDTPNQSGTGDDPRFRIPDGVRMAVLLKTEALFEAGAIDSEKLADIEKALASLIDLNRIYRFI